MEKRAADQKTMVRGDETKRLLARPMELMRLLHYGKKVGFGGEAHLEGQTLRRRGALSKCSALHLPPALASRDIRTSSAPREPGPLLIGKLKSRLRSEHLRDPKRSGHAGFACAIVTSSIRCAFDPARLPLVPRLRFDTPRVKGSDRVTHRPPKFSYLRPNFS